MEPSSGCQQLILIKLAPEDGSICDPKNVGVNFTSSIEPNICGYEHHAL